MHKLSIIALLTVAMTLPAVAAKVVGTTILKDFQPAGVANKHDKHQKHQVFDLTYDAGGNEYVCRTDSDKSVNPTNFVVGSNVSYEMDGKNVNIQTPDNKKVKCKVVRVAVLSPHQPKH
ncbi:MAG TPA: hypothetical protein VF018_00255 [Acidobacteriaceae bacterium]